DPLVDDRELAVELRTVWAARLRGAVLPGRNGPDVVVRRHRRLYPGGCRDRGGRTRGGLARGPVRTCSAAHWRPDRLRGADGDPWVMPGAVADRDSSDRRRRGGYRVAPALLRDGAVMSGGIY